MDAPEPGRLRRFAAAARFHALPLLGLLLVAAAPFVCAMLRGETPFFLDLEDNWYPMRLAAFQARQEGELAHWCGRLFCGVPLLAQVEAALVYPPHFLLDLVHPARTLLPQIVGHRWVVGVLFYAALRLRGASRAGSFLGGAAGVLCGFTTNAVTQLAVLRTVAWLPGLLVASHFFSRGARVAGSLWLAGVCAVVLVAGYAPYLQRSLLLLPFLLVGDPGWPATREQWRERGLRFVGAAAAGVLALTMAAAQLVPSMSLAAESQRSLGLDSSLADGLRAAPADLLMILAPRFTVDGGVVRQGFAYLGLVPICLAILAVVRGRPAARALGAAAAFALVAALGTQTPVGAALVRLPMASSFRNPTQYLSIWWLAVPVLAGLGLDTWTDRRPDRREIAWCVAPVAACLVLAAVVPSLPSDAASRLQLAVATAALAAMLAAWRLAPRPVGAALLVAVALADAGSLAVRFMARPGRTRPTAALYVPDPPLARVAAHHALSGADQPARVITSDAHPNWDDHGVVAGVDDVRGLLSLALLRSMDVSRIVAEGAPFEREPAPVTLYDYGPTHALDSPLIDLVAVRYAVGYVDSPGREWRRIGPEEWERDSVDAARLVPRATAVAPGEEAWRRLVQPGFRPSTTAVVETDAPLGAAAGESDESPGTLRMTSLATNTAEMLVDARRPAVLLWSESFSSGWSATVDGAAAHVLRANHGHMAVVVPAGAHVVRWRFETPGWATGRAVSLAGLAVFAAAALLAWRHAAVATSSGSADRPRSVVSP